MNESKRQCSLQILVDTIQLNQKDTGKFILSDLRLSISLSSFPIVHVAPGSVDATETKTVSVDEQQETRNVEFGGSGKSCTFLSDRSFLQTGKIVFLLVKRIDAFDDYLILAVTSPIHFRDLSLSLPSSSDNYEPPFVSRRFEFLDDMGSCQLRVRLVKAPRRSARSPQKIKSTKTLIHPDSPQKPPPRLGTFSNSMPADRAESRSENVCSPKYGKMKSRNPLLKLLN
jgi:hypothetical protein